MFGDGSIFSYAVAAQDAWAFHWHNISGRLFTYLLAYPVAETVVAVSHNAAAGIAVFGTVFFSAPLLGLALTFAVDRTARRIIFNYACLSTVCLCPFVYGTPTEMWVAHALFWPALALCWSAPTTWPGTAAVFVALLALAFTHEGAIVLATTIMFALFLRGGSDARFLRALGAFSAVLLIWGLVKLTIRPDDYIASVLAAAAFKFIDIRNLAQPASMLLLAGLCAYAFFFAMFRRVSAPKPHVCAAALSAALLAACWIWFDRSLLTEARYDLRTLLLIMIPVFGVMASLHAMSDAERRNSPFPFLGRWASALEATVDPAVVAGALLLVMLVHVVETTRFILGWVDYKAAVRALATGSASDPELGSPDFVSSRRIGADLNRLDWNSTTPYLSVLVTPGLQPTRLVVDPDANYFWLSCKTATDSEQISTAIPAAARHLVRLHACLHR
ncbi:MAG TPA: hypothetical protein VFW22_03120 [Pseudolabrys sp.]|nr:hypothetical protein [Pseudolabrys sp.]